MMGLHDDPKHQCWQPLKVVPGGVVTESGSVISTVSSFPINVTHPGVDVTTPAYPSTTKPYTIPQTIPMPAMSGDVMGALHETHIKRVKRPNPLHKLIGQEVRVNTINSAFSSSGTLLSVDRKCCVIRTVIGQNRNGKCIVDELVVMMREIVSISRNPVNMDVE